ncbi:lipoprotein [Vibrio tubiashii]|nr:lipoprotein [Vibrio tubiashii]
MALSRRDFIRLAGSGIVVASCAPSIALASYPDQPRSLALTNLHTREMLETCYFDGSNYIDKELNRLNHLCRDFRRNEVYSMDKRLFDHISKIQKELGVNTEVQIISGYRSPATNEALRSKSNGVAKKSYHMLGQAIDFRLDGVKLKQVKDVARELKLGGVGYYPRSNFIHIDTGPVRYWS